MRRDAPSLLIAILAFAAAAPALPMMARLTSASAKPRADARHEPQARGRNRVANPPAPSVPTAEAPPPPGTIVPPPRPSSAGRPSGPRCGVAAAPSPVLVRSSAPGLRLRC